jgi:hypothetical protein
MGGQWLVGWLVALLPAAARRCETVRACAMQAIRLCLSSLLVGCVMITAAGAGAAPGARFTDNGDGTVTDNRTGLIWLRDASCAELPRTDDSGRAYGTTAVEAARDLAEPGCGLSDGSRAGDWRLPGRGELESLLALEFYDPALPNAAGTAKWSAGDPFSGVESSYYWSSDELASDPLFVWCVDLSDGIVFYAYEVNYYYVWPVRGGR